jgi:TolB-like protein/tRNA A-37 threonylcarbamoyl transferase component Bud32/tetratricopeptide (TPR) repeat protein
MAGSRRAVLDLLASVADGHSTDWDGVETGSMPPDPASLRVLRTIAGVAEVHRTLDAEAELPVTPDGPRLVQSPPPSAGLTWGSMVLREKLGSGASADVYRAYDSRLDCDVALKLFRKQTGGNREQIGRKLREARMLARVRHDHVVQVFGADEHDGRLGMWMQLVEGRTLEQELAERGRWSGREAALAGQELCRALAAVHSAGFTHGDIKAHNVVREDGGRLVLMDFGAGRTRISEGRQESGTPLYLAPEVLAGGRPGVESDIYSLGVLLYHLVTKTYPITATTIEELKDRHGRSESVPLANCRPDLDLPFVRVVERALAPKPEDRFRSAGEMEAALAQALGTAGSVRTTPWTTSRKVVAATIAAAVVILLMTAAWRLLLAPPVTDAIAVIPFRTIGGTEYAAQLSEGLSMDLTSLLQRVPGLTVVSGVSTQQFRGTTRPAGEIGRTLGVEVLLAGTVQVSGDTISVDVELVDTRTSQSIWSQRYDRQTSDMFATQTEIARSIVEELKGRLSDDDARALERQQMTPQAFELYTLGRYHWDKRTPDGLRLSLDYLEKATAADPNAALPHAGLSDAYTLAGVYGVLPSIEAQRQSEAAALRAIELDATLAEAHAALGSIRQEQFRWSEAESAFNRAIALSPGYSTARHWHALYLMVHRRFDEALEEMNLAIAQDPLSVAPRGALGFIHYMKGDPPTAIGHYRAAIEMEDRPWLLRALSLAHLAGGEFDEALAALDRIEPGTEPAADLNAIRASVYARTGRGAEARALLLADPAVATTDGVSGIEQAAARFALGEEEVAFQWLEAALANRQHEVQYLGVEPRFRDVRGHPRFRALLAQAGLSEP